MKEKENLLLKLDLLESLLKKEDAAPRLGLTKIVAEKRRPGKAQNKDTAQLQQEVKQLKQRVVERKIHHGEVQIQRSLKNAIKVEPLKIQKRIKKVDNEEKRNALEDELKVVADIEVSSMARKMVYRTLLKNFLDKAHRKERPEFLSDGVVKQVLEHESMEGMSTAAKNVFARLMNMDAAKSALKDLVSSIKIVSGLETKQQSSNDTLFTDNTLTTTGNKDKSNHAHVDDYRDPDSSDAQSVAEISGAFQRVNNGKSEKPAKVGSDVDNEVEDDSGESEDEDFFDRNLPKLASGYYSGGSDDEDDYDYDKDAKVLEVTTERKNRRGQRARRRIWELKYGRNANHVKKEREEKVAMAKKRQADFEERQAKRMKRQDAMQERRAQSHGREQLESNAESDKPLHPSWQAKLQQKEVKFQGKKLTFD
jgi:hypothetical protein